MILRSIKISILYFLLPLFLIGCNGAQQSPTVTPGLDLQAVRTAAAQTADARLKELQASTSQTPTATPSPTTTPTPQATATPEGTTPPPETTTLTPPPTAVGGADQATYVKDVTIPDGWVATPGATFTKTWQFMNTGTTTWSTSYELVFVSGDLMDGPASVRLPIEVPPNQLVDISVNLVGPQSAGSYKGFWRLRNPAGQFFGDAVYVQISVGGAAVTTPAGTLSPSGTVTPQVAAVSDLLINVDNANVTAACPYKFTFTTSFKVNQTATITYQLEAGGFSLTLPAPTTETLSPNTYTITYELEITASGTGWARLHVTAPIDLYSSQVTFALTCQ